MGIGTDFDDEHPKVHPDGTVEAAWGWEHAAHTDSWHVATDAGERLTVAEYEAIVTAAAGTMVGFLAALNASPAGPAWARAEGEAQARGQVLGLRARAKARWAARLGLPWQAGWMAA